MTWKSPLSSKFSAISRPPSAAGVRSRLIFRRGGRLVAGVGTF